MRVVATAGHVDHGKSTLVRALTGIDPDRLAEEQERGLTIDLGFAGTELPSGAGISFVDVPGHVRFLKNMLAGVGAVDACLFVVAATEGWKPQSEEHLRILDLLGVGHGVVALTKVGHLDADEAGLARLEVQDHLAGSPLAAAEIVAVDVPAGIGVDDLRGALDRLVTATPPAVDRSRPRLWIDRSFAATGAGTVVTGTLAVGSLTVGATLQVIPSEAAVRVRGLQTLGRSVGSIGPGHRVAVNLTGVSHHDVGRGDALVEPDRWHPARVVDARLRVLDAVHRPLSRRGAHLAYIGSGEHAVRVRVLGRDTIAPGAEGLVRIHLPIGLPLLPGDRYVLRDAGPSVTVGGGEVLDVAPVVPASRAAPGGALEQLVAERGWVDVDDLERWTGRRVPATVGRWVVDPRALDASVDRLRRALSAADAEGIDVAGLDEKDRAVLDTLAGVRVASGRARAADEDGLVGDEDDGLGDHPYLVALAASPFRPPPSDGVDPATLRRLLERGLVEKHGGVHWAAAALDEAARTVADLLAEQPRGVTVSDVRRALDTTRKWAVPLMGALDSRGVTRRRGDVRIAGPRLPGPRH